jgi:hypothetical protein
MHDHGTADDRLRITAHCQQSALLVVANNLDYGRRCTTRNNQVQRSFEDASFKQRALELVAGA